MRFCEKRYADILWMEDFDDKNSDAIDPEEDEEEDYVSEEGVSEFFPNIAQYHFRLRPYNYVKQTLDELKDNFYQYSCAILDINMKQGFRFRGMNSEEEYEMIDKILRGANVRIRDEHRCPNGYEGFKQNAGYYVYLYLLQRGMPSNRIVIFTENKGKKDNLTGKWEKIFEEAGLEPPLAFDKEHEGEKFATWLEKTLDTPHRLRSCMVIMSRYLLDALETQPKDAIEYVGKAFLEKKREWNQQSIQYRSKDDFFENAKLMLQSLQNIPLRLPEGETVACDFFNFKPWIWQVAQPWEATEKLFPKDKLPYAFWTTMRTTRNWLAHSIIASR